MKILNIITSWWVLLFYMASIGEVQLGSVPPIVFGIPGFIYLCFLFHLTFLSWDKPKTAEEIEALEIIREGRALLKNHQNKK